MTTYTVQDTGSADSGLTFREAVERIAEWYEDVDTWSTGYGDGDQHQAVADVIAAIERPEDGDLSDLSDYADSIRQAVAEAMGSQSFAGDYADSIRQAVAEAMGSQSFAGDYVDSIRQAVAEAMGSQSFAGHGNYYVSAADQGGYDLSVEQDDEQDDDE